MSKYNLEFKLEVVKSVIRGADSVSEIARIYDVDRGLVRACSDAYKYHGVDGLTKKRYRYDGQFKVKVVEYMQEHHISAREIAAKFGVSAFETVLKWERIYYEEGRDALFKNERRQSKMTNENKAKPPRKPKIDKNVPEDLVAENQRLRMENACLKKLNALVQERIQRETGKK